METKKCIGCGQELPIDNFYVKYSKSGKRQSRCKVCLGEYNRAYYKNGYSKKQIESSVRNNKAEKVRLQEWKKTLSCIVCGESTSVCLDFHHIDPSTKSATVSSLLFKKAKEEAEKCVVLCANCHRKVHAGLIEL